ncbi:protoporphyrinogen/coproporphyrinogen oxidase [bacterium]
MKKNSNIIIIGGGLSGLSTAYFLSKKNISFKLYEKESDFGGLCRTVKLNGYSFDYTGHLLHTSQPRIEKLLKKLLGSNLKKIERKSWIYSSNVFTPYPFQLNTYRLPLEVKKECLIGYVQAYYKRINSRKKLKNINFKDWVKNYLGDGFGRHFMYPYNNKLWAEDVSNLSTSWLKSYVPKADLYNVIAGALTEPKLTTGYNAFFYYPKRGGIQSLINSFRDNIEDNIHLNSNVSQVNFRKKELIINNQKQNYEYLINSAPLKYFILNILEDAPQKIKNAAKMLKYCTVLNINFGVNRKITDKHWIYFPEDKYIFYRAGFGSNFSEYMAPRNSTAIYTEVSMKKDIEISENKKYAHRILKDLLKAGILNKKDKIQAAAPLKLRPAYVIYDRYRDESVQEILYFLKKKDIFCVGRYGKWEYSAMEHAIMDGYNTSRLFSHI